MKTDAKTMALVLRRAAQNIDKGLKPFKDIQYLGHYGAWIDMIGFDIDESVEYRIKPKTIIVNGVEIPKPLSRCEFSDGDTVFLIGDIDDLYFEVLGLYVTNNGGRFIYKTKEEAIEASKALFGIE